MAVQDVIADLPPITNGASSEEMQYAGRLPGNPQSLLAMDGATRLQEAAEGGT